MVIVEHIGKYIGTKTIVFWSQSNSVAGRVLALLVINLGLIPETMYVFSSPVRSDP